MANYNYPNYYMGNPYMQNPMLSQQNRLQSMENQFFGNNQQPQQNNLVLKGRPVTSFDEAKASMIDLDGSVFIFPDYASGKIYTKQINMDGTASIRTYELVNPMNMQQSNQANQGANEKLPHEQLMRAINVFAIGCDFHENASLDSHKLGLQGFKRLHRYFSRKDNEAKMKLEHYCIDMFGEKVMSDWDKLENPKISNTVKEMLESYLEHETEKYAIIAEIANILTMNEFLHESHMLRKELEPVTREIIKCKRYIQDFENSDWSWHHIRYIDNMLHTKYKEKECEEFSYKD